MPAGKKARDGRGLAGCRFWRDAASSPFGAAGKSRYEDLDRRAAGKRKPGRNNLCERARTSGRACRIQNFGRNFDRDEVWCVQLILPKAEKKRFSRVEATPPAVAAGTFIAFIGCVSCHRCFAVWGMTRRRLKSAKPRAAGRYARVGDSSGPLAWIGEFAATRGIKKCSLRTETSLARRAASVCIPLCILVEGAVSQIRH